METGVAVSLYVRKNIFGLVQKQKTTGITEILELSDTVASALEQISRMQYEAAFIQRGIPKEHIRKYGFAFRGKEVLIG